MLQSNDVLRPDGDRIAGDVIEGEAIIIDLETGVYYSLDRVGATVWSLVSRGTTFAMVVGEITARYDVDPVIAENDLRTLVDTLIGEGLLTIDGEGGSAAAPEAGPADKAGYAAPELRVYRDLGDLLALDPPAPGMNRISWRKSGGGGGTSDP